MATAVSRMDQKNLKNKHNGFILPESNQLSFRDREMNYPIFEVTITICIKILELVVGVEPTKGRLQIYCSTVVPHQHAPRIFIEYRGFPLSHQVYDSLDALGCYPSRIFTSSALKRAVLVGFEPTTFQWKVKPADYYLQDYKK